jgi:hypothetical protein
VNGSASAVASSVIRPGSATTRTHSDDDITLGTFTSIARLGRPGPRPRSLSRVHRQHRRTNAEFHARDVPGSAPPTPADTRRNPSSPIDTRRHPLVGALSS